MHQIRLLVMCDSLVVRRSLAVIFASDSNFVVVGETECDSGSITEAKKLQPDAILGKIPPDDEKGITLIGQLKEACPYSRMFVFIDNDYNWEAYIALAAEVDGWLSKSMLPGDLVKAVELTCRAGVLCLPGFLKKIIRGPKKIIDESSNTGGETEKCPLLPLTIREMEIYQLLLQNNTNKEIGSKLFISQPTVKSHVSSILRKLGLSSRTQLVLNELQNRGAITSLNM